METRKVITMLYGENLEICFEQYLEAKILGETQVILMLQENMEKKFPIFTVSIKDKTLYGLGKEIKNKRRKLEVDRQKQKLNF